MTGRAICVAFIGFSFLTSYVGGSIRLIGGDDQYEGRIEIYNSEEWQSFCYDYWDTDNTVVACRQMGFQGGSKRRVQSSEVSDNTFWSRGVKCDGNENRLEDCVLINVRSSRCTHSGKDDVYITCKPQKDGVLRLRDGRIQNEGRLEIYHNGEWGTICVDRWRDYPQNTQIACRQLGYEGGTFRATSSTVDYWMYEVKCQGNETSIQECSFSGWGDARCDPQVDIFLICDENKDNLTRLVDGSTLYEGRLEVYHDGQWGSVCIQQWDSFVLNAHVACRQLGFTGGSFRPVTTTERGEGPFWMDNIECDGDEINLRNCNYKGMGNENCSHSSNDDVFLQCNPLKGAVQLFGGSNRYSGRVQIFATGKWISLCNDDWTNNNLKVTCRQLGTIGKRSDHEAHTEGFRYSGDYDCKGTEGYLSNCDYDYGTWCSSDENVVVTCEIPVSTRNGRCDTDLQETCNVTLTCQDVNGFGRCICDSESYWDEKTSMCKNKVSYNEVCDPIADDVCSINLSCIRVNEATSFQYKCLCPAKNDFWDISISTCRKKKFYAEVCDPSFEDVCTTDLSCEFINGTSLSKCICPDEDDFWDTSYRACRNRTELQGIYVADRLNITDAISNCETRYKGQLATEEHLQQILSTCTDYVDDTWLIGIGYPATEKQLGSCALLYSDGELTTENCTGRRASVCVIQKNNKSDPLCFGFPTMPLKSSSTSVTSAAGVIGAVVAVSIILVVVVLVGIGLLYRRRKRNYSKNSDKINNHAYGLSDIANGRALQPDNRLSSNPETRPEDEYDYAMGADNRNAKDCNHSNIYINDMTTRHVNEGYISSNDTPGYANYTEDSFPPDDKPQKNGVENSFTYMLLDDPPTNTNDLPDESYNTFSDMEADLPPTDTYDHVHDMPEDGYDQFQRRSNERSNFETNEETGYMQSSFPG